MRRGRGRWLSLALVMQGAVSCEGVCGASGYQAPAVEGEAAPVALSIRAYADGRVAPGTLPRAYDVARRILDAAGLHTRWRLCGVSEVCSPEQGLGHDVVVILSSQARPDGLHDCGRAARRAGMSEGTVVVSVPCVKDVVLRLTRPSRNRANPVLASARYEDVAGAVVAHEIGHVLGIRHAPAGVMRSQLGAEEVISLGLGRLAFSEPEAALLRARARLASRE